MAGSNGLVWMSDVKERQVRWLWHGVLAYGQATVLDGDPSLGKSTIGFDLVGRITSCRPMPDGQALRKPEVCLIVTAEDDLATTVRPRLRAAGADLDRVVTLALERDRAGNPVPFQVPDDIPRLAAAIRTSKARFVMIDPVMAVMSERIQTGNDASVRKAMSPLTELARRSRAAFLLLRHLTKDSSNTRAMYRGGGSIAITAAARVVLIAARKPDDPETRVLAHTKNNLLPESQTPGLEYRVEGWKRDPRIACIEWLGASEFAADDLLRQHDGRRDDYAQRQAAAFWTAALADGPRAMQSVLREATDAGISQATLRRAASRLDVHKYRKRGRDGKTQRWYAHLPNQPCPGQCRHAA